MNPKVSLTRAGAVERGELGAYAGADGRTLRYRVVRAEEERHALLYLHGIESHGAWFLAAAEGPLCADARLICSIVAARG
jgi:hypothetical protein